MHITATPLVIPPQEEKTFDKFWPFAINIYGDYPDSKLDVVLKRFRTVSETEIEYAQEEPTIISIENLLERIQQDPEMQDIMGRLFNKIQGLLDERANS